MEGLAAYSHLLSRVERSLVLDIGCRYTKCGFAGKHSPSVIIPTRFITSSGKEVCFYCVNNVQRTSFNVFIYFIAFYSIFL